MAPSIGIPEYYAGKTLFITGATGFMGKVLVEKLLYSCPDIKKMYLLLRPKKGHSSKERLDDLLNFRVSAAILCRVANTMNLNLIVLLTALLNVKSLIEYAWNYIQNVLSNIYLIMNLQTTSNTWKKYLTNVFIQIPCLTWYKNLQVFDRLKAEHPKRFEKLQVVAGDILSEDLGISDEDRRQLQEETQIIFHCAACVR